MRSFVASDENAHLAEVSSAWTETWEWRLVDPVAALAVVVAVVRRPAERRASYVAAVMGAGRDTVAVVEHDLAEPRVGLELRGSGIWADHVCETPFDHWSLGLEAFGLRLDDPDDAIGGGLGHVTPVGVDLEWEDESPATGLRGELGYLTVGVAHGEVLVGDARLEVEGPGHRLHRWGAGRRFPSWRAVSGAAHPVDDLDIGRGHGDAGRQAAVLARAVADSSPDTVVEWLLESASGSAGDDLGLRSRTRRSAPA